MSFLCARENIHDGPDWIASKTKLVISFNSLVFFDFIDDSFTKGDERKLRRKYKDRINVVTSKNCWGYWKAYE